MHICIHIFPIKRANCVRMLNSHGNERKQAASRRQQLLYPKASCCRCFFSRKLSIFGKRKKEAAGGGRNVHSSFWFCRRKTRPPKTSRTRTDLPTTMTAARQLAAGSWAARGKGQLPQKFLSGKGRIFLTSTLWIIFAHILNAHGCTVWMELWVCQIISED